MTALPFVHRHEPEAAVAALCRLTGLAPGAVAAILAEIADDDLPAYRKRLLADALPCIWGAYLAGGYAACAAPEVWPRLVRTCVANFCGFYGLAPSRLANSTAHRAANGNWADTPSPERVAAIFCELDEQMVASLRC